MRTTSHDSRGMPAPLTSNPDECAGSVRRPASDSPLPSSPVAAGSPVCMGASQHGCAPLQPTGRSGGLKVNNQFLPRAGPPELTSESQPTWMRSSKPCTPLGMTRKSCSPRRFWVLLKGQWSVASTVSTPPARPALSWRWCSGLRMGGLITNAAATCAEVAHNLGVPCVTCCHVCDLASSLSFYATSRVGSTYRRVPWATP